MAERRAYVYAEYEDSATGPVLVGYHVFPGVVVLDDVGFDDKFKLINFTDVDFTVTITGNPFDKEIRDAALGKKGSKDKSDKIGPLKPKKGGAFRYVVKDAAGKHAQGNSDPVIIIDM